MPSWNAGQYLRFAEERTRPCRDLAAAIALEAPGRIVDLGCGPGNSTAVLAERWPRAHIEGIDNAEEMIKAARRAAPALSFEVGDIAHWKPESAYNLVFSNAALQWVEDHGDIYPRLFSSVAPGGAFAAQVPCNKEAPAHQEMRRIAALPEFQGYFKDGLRQWHVHEAAYYYDILSPLASRMDIWLTEYLHVLPDAAAIVEWYKGTGLRPFLDRLPEGAPRERFLAAYLDAIIAAYPPQRDGRVLLPFRRLFVVAYR